MESAFLLLISKAVSLGRQGILSLLHAGLTEKDFEPDLDSKEFFLYISKYVKEYSDAPSPDTLLGELGIQLPEAPIEPLAFWVSKVKELILHLTMESKLSIVTTLMDEGRTFEAWEALENSATSLRSLRKEKTKGPVSIFGAEGPLGDVKKRYLRLKAGERGVPVPWPTWDEAMRGLWPEEFVLLVARTGVGKTWALLCWAIHAWRLGHNVLFVTTELSHETIAFRTLALKFGMDYSKMRTGKLPSLHEAKFLMALDNPYEPKPSVFDTDGNRIPTPMTSDFWLVGGDHTGSIGALDAVVEELKPDLLLVDGMYLFKAPGVGRTEKMATLFNDFKILLIRHKIPGIVTHQMNRDGAKKKSLGGGMRLEHISLSDNAGWVSDYVFALTQTKEQNSDGEMTLIPLKHREVVISKLLVNWKFDVMDFTEAADNGPRPERPKYYSPSAGYKQKPDKNIPF